MRRTFFRKPGETCLWDENQEQYMLASRSKEACIESWENRRSDESGEVVFQLEGIRYKPLLMMLVLVLVLLLVMMRLIMLMLMMLMRRE